MRKLAALFMAPLMACSAGNAEPGETVEARGQGPSRTYDVSGFTEVGLRGSDDVEVRVGPAFSVRAQGPAEELDRLEIVREGDALKIGRKRTSGMSWGKQQGVKVFVTLPRLVKAGVAGSGDMAVDQVTGGRFDAAVAGSGNLTIGSMDVGDAKFAVAGSGDLTSAGRARRLDLSVAGSGDIDARQVAAAEAKVSVAGSGDVRARVDGPVAVNLVGSGDVELTGSPRCTINTRGSGQVRCS